MAILNIPDKQLRITDVAAIKDYLNERGIWFDQWEAGKILPADAGQDEVLDAYSQVLQPFMKEHEYQVADVININENTPDYPALRNKFLHEHRHTEDEVRFFVDGEGYFWFHPDNEEEPVFNVLCQAGDLISVPANTRHWFDAGKHKPFVKAIRVFIDKSGWVPHYTESGVDANYNPS